MKKLLLLSFVGLLQFSIAAQNYPYRDDFLWVTDPSNVDWLYKVGENASVMISLYEYGVKQSGVEIKWEVGPELMPATMSGVVIPKNGIAIVNMGTLKAPGFLDLRLSAELHGQATKHHIKVGFEPEKLKPITKLPKDFGQFWDAAKEEAAKCPMKVERTFVPELSTDKVDRYLVKIQAFEVNQQVYGYLSIPKKEGKFPVVFSPPGAGIKPLTPEKHLFYAENGFIRFDMEIHGIRPDLDAKTYKEISRAFSYYEINLDNKDLYYMKKVYMSCVRALDYLITLPEWDGKNLIAQGGSQGGALALITAGLDDRITLCAANHPALSDMAGYTANRAGGYPHFFTRYKGADTPDKIQTMQYYDVVNFARQIQVPVFMTWGYNDDTCPATTSYVVYNALDTQKEALITPVNEHWVSTATRHKILEWIERNLN